jgi:hypothetical protein
MSLPPGAGQLTTIEPKAAGGHVEYVGLQLHIITAVLGVTYEMATGDMSQSQLLQCSRSVARRSPRL